MLNDSMLPNEMGACGPIVMAWDSEKRGRKPRKKDKASRSGNREAAIVAVIFLETST